MTTHEIQLLIRHEMWASQRVAEALLNLHEIPEKAEKLMNHVLGAQDIWISRISGTAFTLGVFPTLDKDLWYEYITKHEGQLLHIAADKNNLERIVDYKNTQGNAYSNRVSELILHLAMHSQYHRGQIIAYSRDMLETVPATDMIAFLRLI